MSQGALPGDGGLEPGGDVGRDIVCVGGAGLINNIRERRRRLEGEEEEQEEQQQRQQGKSGERLANFRRADLVTRKEISGRNDAFAHVWEI